MAQEEANKSYEDFVSQILRPTNLPNLKAPIQYEKVSILIYRDASSDEPSEELELDNIYPFYTLADLSTFIYHLKETKSEFHPKNQCFMKETRPGKFTNLKYLFNKSTYTEVASPFDVITSGKANPAFVDVEGNPRIQDITSRNQMLLEDILFKKYSFKEDDVYTIHLFLYTDIYAAYPGIRPVNRVDWEGMFKVYFPEYDKSQEDGSLTQEEEIYAPVRVQRFLERQKAVEKLDQMLIEEMPLRKPGETTRGDAINFSNVRNLRFTWDKPRAIKDYQAFRLESVFYDTPVSEEMPYIRYYPVSNATAPISKIHVDGPLGIPTMEDPQILIKWSQERPLLPEQEFISAKVLIRPGSGSVHPLYGTLSIFQDGTAMFSIQPNTDAKSLSKQADLYNLVAILDSVMSRIPGLQPKLGKALPPIKIYSPNSVKLADAYVVLSLWLDREDKEVINTKSLGRTLPFFRSFFQITTSPIKEQSPIAFLRYKCVNNFQTPSRDFQFLMRVLDLQKIQGQTSIPTLVKIYKEEFDVSEEVAGRRVSSFVLNKDKYSIVNPETLEYTQEENPGIDIAIFGKHPFYTFHIYRVDSQRTLQRIKTLLSLLISVSPDNFKEQESLHSAEVLEEEQKQEEVSADAQGLEAEGEEGGVEQELKSMAVQSVVEEELGLDEGGGEAAEFDDGLGDFDGFGEEETSSGPAASNATALRNFRLGKGQSAAPGAPVAAAPPPPPPRPGKTPLQALVDATAEGEEGEGGEEDEEEGAGAGAGAAGDAKLEDAKEDDDEITDVAEIKQQASKVYFRKRLQFYDKTLFSYSKTHPSLKKYPSMCAANALKQPTVMSEDEYERMKDLYSKEITKGSVLFIEYPLKKGTSMPTGLDPDGKKTEIISILRYGSNLLPGQANIFICSEYWCRYDEIVILKDEFENKGLDRKGKPKDKNMCPFCRKGLVTNKSAVLEGESVISRSVKGKKHRFVNFLKKTPHPQGLYLPCCFISNHYIDTEHPAYLPLKIQAQKLVKGGPVAAAGARLEAAENPPETKAVNYRTTLQSIFSDSMSDRPYIVGAEKLPLEFTKNGPQIGVIPKGADTYFTQNSLGTATIPGLVVQDHTVWKLMTDNTTKKTNATGFFRIAAENSKRNQPESFFSAIAPYFGENSAAGVKRRILDIMTPSLFLSLNYGNLLFDFYDPTSTPNIEEDPETKKKRVLNEANLIRQFAAKLKIDVSGGPRKDLLQRAWKGYTRFMDIMMNDATYTKEYRQFAQLLSIPNILHWEDFSQEKRIRHNGILFIVLEVGHDNTVEVRCPPYGVTPHDAGCDVAFILKYASGIWEPLFHVNGYPNSDITMVFSRDTHASWPPIVKQRVAEFEKMCHSSGLGIYTDSPYIQAKYTDSPYIQAKSLIPLSKAIDINTEDGTQVNGIMRDIYNHVSFVIYKVEGGLVLVPVIDDGSVHHNIKLEVEWRNLYLKLAKEDVVRKFYAEKVPPMLDSDNEVQVEIYKTQRLLSLGKTDETRNYVYALVLGNNLHVPVRKSDAVAEELEEGSETMWSIDRKIAFGKLEADVVKTVDYKDFEEIYQHLRFSFSNWYALMDSPTLKKEINAILFKDGLPNMDLPLYEKRQRLFIRLYPVLKAWLDPSAHTPDRNPSLKRIDCRVIVEKEGCKGRCVWKEEAEGAGAESHCLLHTPENVTMGSKEVSAVDLLIKKLIEELIRFPVKCMELIKQRVSQYVKLTSAFRSGDQYIVPEDLPAWSEILRMEWRKKQESRYYEEYAAIEPQPYEPEHVVPAFSTSSNPELKTLVGDNFFFIEEPSGSIARIIEKQGLSEDYLDSIGQDMDTPIIDEETAKQISKKLRLSIYQMLYEPGNPVPSEPIIVKLKLHAKERPAPFLVLVKLPDERVGTITMRIDALEPIPSIELPMSIRKVLIQKKEFTQIGP